MRSGVMRVGVYSVDKLMHEARRLASEYRRATGKPLAVGGEIAKYDAIRLLGLEPAPPDVTGYDAVGRGRRAGERYQVKGRVVFDESKSGHRIGQLKMNQEWDRVALVLMDADFEPSEIYEADRASIIAIHERARRSRRAARGLMSVARFKIIGDLVWARDRDDGYRNRRAESG